MTTDEMPTYSAAYYDEDAAYHAEARGDRYLNTYTDSYNYDGGANTPNDAGVLGSDPDAPGAGPYTQVFSQPQPNTEAPEAQITPDQATPGTLSGASGPGVKEEGGISGTLRPGSPDGDPLAAGIPAGPTANPTTMGNPRRVGSATGPTDTTDRNALPDHATDAGRATVNPETGV
ncbi:MAG: hypothetical protein ABI068_15735 [Ktedonobacterales bacterium]